MRRARDCPVLLWDDESSSAWASLSYAAVSEGKRCDQIPSEAFDVGMRAGLSAKRGMLQLAPGWSAREV